MGNIAQSYETFLYIPVPLVGQTTELHLPWGDDLSQEILHFFFNPSLINQVIPRWGNAIIPIMFLKDGANKANDSLAGNVSCCRTRVGGRYPQFCND